LEEWFSPERSPFQRTGLRHHRAQRRQLAGELQTHRDVEPLGKASRRFFQRSVGALLVGFVETLQETDGSILPAFLSWDNQQTGA